MIVAILPNGTIVKIESAENGRACCSSLDRAPIGRTYVGGMGYVSTPFAHIDPSAFTHVAVIDESQCAEYQDWQAAQYVTDLVNGQPGDVSALALEEQARFDFLQLIHTYSIARPADVLETTPNSPRTAPARPNMEEARIGKDLCSQRLAIHRPSGTG